jgi:hypothetical protein
VQRFDKMERDDVELAHAPLRLIPAFPVALSVQMSMDGVVREVYIIDESQPGSGLESLVGVAVEESALGSVSKTCIAFVLVAVATGCASFDGRGLVAGQSSATDVERVMGAPAEKRQVGGETWYFYPRQPYGRVMYVARVTPDGKLAALEQRLNDATVAKIIPNTTRAQEVRDLLGPPYTAVGFPRMERDTWTW